MPNLPNITPEITLSRCETINLLLSSIAMEEMGLSHILNAEGEKLQSFLKQKHLCSEHYFQINESVHLTLRNIIKSQLLLQLKLEDVVTLEKKCCSCKRCDSCHPFRCCKKRCTSCNDE